VSQPPASSRNLALRQAKYHDRNPIVRYANRRFMDTIHRLTSPLAWQSMLDLGCGEGMVLERVFARHSGQVVGMDLDQARVALARRTVRAAHFLVGDAHALPFADCTFDLVISLEVLEHVGRPEDVLREIGRVCRRYVLLSVPNEPWWRLGNMARLKYLKEWGNTPEHIHHWTVGGFKRWVERTFTILRTATPFLWTFVLAEKRQ